MKCLVLSRAKPAVHILILINNLVDQEGEREKKKFFFTPGVKDLLMRARISWRVVRRWGKEAREKMMTKNLCQLCDCSFVRRRRKRNERKVSFSCVPSPLSKHISSSSSCVDLCIYG